MRFYEHMASWRGSQNYHDAIQKLRWMARESQSDLGVDARHSK